MPEAGHVFPARGPAPFQHAGDGLGQGGGFRRDLVKQLHALLARAARDVVKHVDGQDHGTVDAGPPVIAMREIAMDGACGPGSTPATSAASSRRAWPGAGNSPRVISQTICG